MGFLSDEEITEVWKLIHQHVDWIEEERIEFTNGFQEGWKQSERGIFVIPWKRIYLVMNRIRNTTDIKSRIKEFSNCLGILVGVFEFQQEKILENPHYWLACLNVLRMNPEFQDMYNMLRKVVNHWNHDIKIKKDSLTLEQREGYDEFIRDAPPDLIE